MENILATHPFQLAHLDHLTIETMEGRKDVHILFIADHFIQYAQAPVTTSKTAKCMAQALWDKIIVSYAVQENLISDQGQNFKRNLIAELCQMTEV